MRVRALHQHLVRPMVLRHHGRIFSLAGDGAMVAFPAAGDAVSCAVAVQQAFDQLAGLGRFRCEPLGERQLAKLATPSRVYRVGRP